MVFTDAVLTNTTLSLDTDLNCMNVYNVYTVYKDIQYIVLNCICCWYVFDVPNLHLKKGLCLHSIFSAFADQIYSDLTPATEHAG